MRVDRLTLLFDVVCWLQENQNKYDTIHPQGQRNYQVPIFAAALQYMDMSLAFFVLSSKNRAQWQEELYVIQVHLPLQLHILNLTKATRATKKIEGKEKHKDLNLSFLYILACSGHSHTQWMLLTLQVHFLAYWVWYPCRNPGNPQICKPKNER